MFLDGSMYGLKPVPFTLKYVPFTLEPVPIQNRRRILISHISNCGRCGEPGRD